MNIPLDFFSKQSVNEYQAQNRYWKGVILKMPIKNLRSASHFGFSGDYHLPPFWVVIMPTVESELEDILFESDLFSFILQEKGGLKGYDIVGIYANHAEAKKIAQRLLKKRKA